MVADRLARHIGGALTVLIGLALVGSFGIGFLTHSDTVRLAGSDLTITADIVDRILLALFFILLLATLAVWQKLRSRN
jgi:hypothetical protein